MDKLFDDDALGRGQGDLGKIETISSIIVRSGWT